MPALSEIVRPNAWRVALERFGAATGLTVGVYEAPERLILGPINPTPLFDAINAGHDVPAMFADCVRHCRSEGADSVLMEDDGVAVVGTPLTSAGKDMGAVVAGYGLADFPDEVRVRRFVQRHGRRELPVWLALRRQAPLSRRRLGVYADCGSWWSMTTATPESRSG